MNIQSIDNANFKARFQIKNANTNKLVKGVATATAGAASLYTGLNASNILPGDFAKDIYNAAKSEQVIGYPVVYHEHVKENESAALSAGSTMLSSSPLGATVTPYGSYAIKKTMQNKSDNLDKNIPSD